MRENVTAPRSAAGQYAKKRVVIVDDSLTMRGWLRVVLQDDPRLEVVGEADCAIAARQVIKETNPDVVTLDIEMPGMSGLEFLEKLMRLRPLPVVMISAATKTNSEATITALSLGAVDCILKPTSLADDDMRSGIIRRVFSAACSSVQVVQPNAPVLQPRTPARKGPQPLILIGASTGGVAALERLLLDLPLDSPPIVIVQHMPANFLVSFSRHLNQKLPHSVSLAREDEVLGSSQIRLAPAMGQHTTVTRKLGAWRCSVTPEQQGELHCPSVDALFASAVDVASDVIAVMLTGLGRDGAEAMQRLHTAGARTLGQDETTSVVYGMPRAAWELGAIDVQLPLPKLGAAVMQAVADHGKSSTLGRRI